MRTDDKYVVGRNEGVVALQHPRFVVEKQIGELGSELGDPLQRVEEKEFWDCRVDPR